MKITDDSSLVLDSLSSVPHWKPQYFCRLDEELCKSLIFTDHQSGDFTTMSSGEVGLSLLLPTFPYTAHLAVRNFMYRNYVIGIVSSQKHPTDENNCSVDSDVEVIVSLAAKNPSAEYCSLSEDPFSLALQVKPQ